MIEKTKTWLGEVFHPIAARFMLTAGQSSDVQSGLAATFIAGGSPKRATLEAAYAQIFHFSYPYDAAFDLAYASAMEFARQNREMIDDAFGSAENYAEYYGETNTGAGQKFMVSTNASVHSKLAARAFDQNSFSQLIESGHVIRIRALTRALHSLVPFAPMLAQDLNPLEIALEHDAGFRNHKGESRG